MPVRCEDLRDELSRLSDGTEVATSEVTDHVSGCLRCQAELVQYRKLLRALHQMRTEVLTPHPGMVTDVLARIEEASERRAIRSLLQGRRGAYLGGIAAASVAAGAAGAIVLVRRSALSRAAS